MLRWKAGSFEILPNEVPRPRTIFSSYESLLMETAQTIDETESDRPPAEEENPLAGFARYKGVQMVVAVDGTDPTKVEHWGSDNAEELAAWVHHTTRALHAVGERLEGGPLEQIEALGPQRHLAVISSDTQDLAVGFTRSATLPYIRETMKQIEAKWVS